MAGPPGCWCPFEAIAGEFGGPCADADFTVRFGRWRPRAARALAQELHVFLTSADGPEKVAHETAVIDAAVAASVGCIVKLPSPHVLLGSDLVFWDWHGRIEQHLRASGVPAVCLRAGFVMSNLSARPT